MRRGRSTRWGAAVAAVAGVVALSQGPAGATDTDLVAYAQQAAGQRIVYSYPGLTRRRACWTRSARARPRA